MLFSLFHKPFLLFGKGALPQELANPRRILLTHFGKPAETVQSIPVLVALRHRFPHADIAWLIGEQIAPLVLDHWAVNRFIVVRRDWVKHFSEIRRVRRRLQSFAPQVAIDPQNTFDSSLATWLSSAKYRIGLGGKRAHHFHNIHIVSEESHRIEQSLQLLQPFGIFGSGIDFDMPECGKDSLTARHILHHAGLHGNFALLHISADHPSARWQEERFGAVAKYLQEQWNLPSLITWSNHEEWSRAESTVLAAGGAALQAPWTISLIERKSLSKLATLFIGSDTTELQIAAAVGTKCIGLFGPTSASENSPFGQEHRTIQATYNTRHKKRKQKGSSEWMDHISPELVCEKCDEVLTEKKSPPATMKTLPSNTIETSPPSTDMTPPQVLPAQKRAA